MCYSWDKNTLALCQERRNISMSDSHTVQAVEQQILTALASQKQRFHAYVETCPLGSTPAVMGQWISGLDQFAWTLQQLAPATEWLKRQNRLQAEQVLTFLLRDMSGARDVYLQMYQGMVQTQQQIEAIWRGANQVATANVLAATRYSQAVFAKWQTDYFDITEQRCYDCHTIIGIPGGGLCYPCARKRGLVW
jgi:hypothetical protein